MATIYTNIILGSEIQEDWQRAHDVYFTSGRMKDNSALNQFTKEDPSNYTDRKCNVATTNTYDTEVNSIVERSTLTVAYLDQLSTKKTTIIMPTLNQLLSILIGVETMLILSWRKTPNYHAQWVQLLSYGIILKPIKCHRVKQE